MFTIGAGDWGCQGWESVSLSVRQSVGERGFTGFTGRRGWGVRDGFVKKGIGKIILSAYLKARFSATQEKVIFLLLAANLCAKI